MLTLIEFGRLNLSTLEMFHSLSDLAPHSIHWGIVAKWNAYIFSSGYKLQGSVGAMRHSEIFQWGYDNDNQICWKVLSPINFAPPQADTGCKVRCNSCFTSRYSFGFYPSTVGLVSACIARSGQVWPWIAPQNQGVHPSQLLANDLTKTYRLAGDWLRKRKHVATEHRVRSQAAHRIGSGARSERLGKVQGGERPWSITMVEVGVPIITISGASSIS